MAYELDRRRFLKLFGLVGTSATAGGCSRTTRTLLPYIFPPEDIVPGHADWYATTCRECPAGCGMLAKNRDGRIVKVEGNPVHPVSGGKLCIRGQSSLQGLYNPDRFRGPMSRLPNGELTPAGWPDVTARFHQMLQETRDKKRPDSIVFMTDLMTGTMDDLVDLWLLEIGQPSGRIIYEPYAYEPLRYANRLVFGYDAVPSYRIDQADFLISFNAGFLETWISNLEYSRQYQTFRELGHGARNPSVFVGPRLSLTANNSDNWIPVQPGDEYLVALGMLKVIHGEALSRGMPAVASSRLATLVAPWTLEQISAKTGVSTDQLKLLARRFAAARKPLALAEGLSLTLPNATETAVAANLLCSVVPGTKEMIDFSRPHSYSSVTRASEMKRLSDRMRAGEIEMLLIDRANPVYSLPAGFEFRKAMESVPRIVSFSSEKDETSSLADLVLPSHSPYESWGDYSPRPGVTGLLQPVMGPVFNTRPLGDVLISSGKKVMGPEKFPWKDYYEVLQNSWSNIREQLAADLPQDAFWNDCVQRGGSWPKTEILPKPIGTEHITPPASNLPEKSAPPGSSTLSAVKVGNPVIFALNTGTAVDAGPAAAKPELGAFSFPMPDGQAKPSQGLSLIIYPTVQFFDGRGASRSWLQEIPDPMTQVTWGGWAEIHPKTAERLGIEKGEMLRLKTASGSFEVPALPIFTVPENMVAVPIGQGHTSFGRFADALPGNPLPFTPHDIDPSSGGIVRISAGVSVEKTGKEFVVAHTDGSFYEHDRDIVHVTTMSEYRTASNSRTSSKLDLPLPEGYDKEKDFYKAHEHSEYRWSMVVDMDRCIACGACIAACYAENNVATVGRDQVIKGREMAWIRAERYFDPERPKAHWVMMLCQHCDRASCESVCPIFAPHHSKEGLNNQVYNRCFGTRFCYQNDPYKVRRFNWFTFTRPSPLELQLNPDVTVRQKGVMEKCSFCIQRIIEARTRAREEGRKIRDGEFTTACAQTCPTNALIFGSLMDPDSQVSQLIKSPRAYQVLAHLNTKPAAIYLKRVMQDALV